MAVVRFSVVGCLAGLDGAFSSVKLGNELEKPRVFSHCCIDHRWLGDLFYNHGSFTPNTVNNQRFCPVNNCQIDLQYFNFLPVIDSIFQLFFSDYGRFERVFKSNHRCHQGDKFYETNRWHNNTSYVSFIASTLFAQISPLFFIFLIITCASESRENKCAEEF